MNLRSTGRFYRSSNSSARRALALCAAIHRDRTVVAGLPAGGVRVTLFERAAEPGGRAGTQDYNGFKFNRGVHALYEGGATTAVLAELGIPIRTGIPKDVFALDRGGIVGDDGRTHQGLFDIAYLRPLPGMVLMAPKDEAELRQMVWTAVRYAERGAGRANDVRLSGIAETAYRSRQSITGEVGRSRGAAICGPRR